MRTDGSDKSPPNSPNVGMARKRKRPKAMVDDEDEMDMDSQIAPRLGSMNVEETRQMPPPPPPLFFADPSSSLHVGTGFELDTSDAASISEKPKKKAQKNKKPVKAASEDGPQSDQPKPKKKTKVKVTTKKQMEVVIETSSKAGSTTMKGPFKSKEFIEDDDEDDPLAMPPLRSRSSGASPNIPAQVEDSEHSFTRELDDELAQSVNPKSKIKSAQDKGKKAANGTKRKRVVDSDDELAAPDVESDPTASTLSITKKAKGKIFVLSDDEVVGDNDGLEINAPSTMSTSSRGSKGKKSAKNVDPLPETRPSKATTSDEDNASPAPITTNARSVKVSCNHSSCTVSVFKQLFK